MQSKTKAKKKENKQARQVFKLN